MRRGQVFLLLYAFGAPLLAQTPGASAQQPPRADTGTGQVLFSRDKDTAAQANPSASSVSAVPDTLRVTDAERSALTFTAYDLDLHITPSTAAISTRAVLTVRNDSGVPLPRITLQVSSSLQWDAISTRTASSASTVPFTTHEVLTDADHTGSMSEAVLTLAHPLSPGQSLSLTALYSGTIAPSAERLLRIGAPNDQAVAADWDSIAPPDASGLTGGTALRGFGNVLWYPVSETPVFLGDKAKLFQAVGAAKLRESDAAIRLRLAVEYVGDPPDAVFFCGRRAQLRAISDEPNLPAAEAPGVATAEFESRPLGFRTPNIFLTAAAPTVTGPPDDMTLLAAVTGHYDALPVWSSAAAQVEPLLADWFGPQPLTPLTLLDHPGQRFEDDALLVRPIRAADDPATLDGALVHSLTHAWIHSDRAWIDEGLAEFAALLWTERTAGRTAALAELQESARTLAVVEPEAPASELSSGSTASFSSGSDSIAAVSDPREAVPSAVSAIHGPSSAGASLAAATGDAFYRIKAAAVWWMLRSIAGDEALKQTLQAYRLDVKLDRDPAGIEHTLERFSHKDLSWFFNDWVYRDRGLPDLSIVNVTPSQIDSASGLPAGWLVAVVVRNDGYATADVPVTVRSGSSIETQHLRIAGRSTGSTRIVFAGTPSEVEVNDGGVPEAQTSIHTRQLALPGR